MLVYTIGHSTRTTEGFVELLDEFSVKHLVDVRRYPGSRRNPHFSRDVLQKNLKDLRIGVVAPKRSQRGVVSALPLMKQNRDMGLVYT